MNRFRLPYHLIVEESVFEDIPKALGDVFPKISSGRTVVVTEENLKSIFAGILDEIQKDFSKSELYLIQKADYDSAVALAKYITMNDIKTVIGFGGGTVLDLAKFAAFVSKTKYISLPTTLSNDSLASPVAVLGTEGRARKSFRCTIPDAILIDVNVVKSAPDRQLLAGIGDTLRVSLTGDPVREPEVGLMILRAVGLRRDEPELIACPTCGRTEIDLPALYAEVEDRLKEIHRPLKVAVMGCVVNGPGEAAGADYGVAGGRDYGILFRKGERVGKYPYAELTERLFALIRADQSEGRT